MQETVAGDDETHHKKRRRRGIKKHTQSREKNLAIPWALENIREAQAYIV
jgi:hypothetical protein